MELKKGKYKKAEVEKMLEEKALSYHDKIQEFELKIAELSSDNSKLLLDINALKSKEELVVQALANAEKTAREKEKSLELNYLSSVNSLKTFLSKWTEYFNYILDKYPFYPAIKQANDLKNELESLIYNKTSEKNTIEKLGKTLKKNEKSLGADFSPKQKIQEYIAVTSDNGFNLDEVLNPGNLRLEDLCKELGLLEEND